MFKENYSPQLIVNIVLRMFAFARQWTDAQHILQLIAQCLIMIIMHWQMTIFHRNQWYVCAVIRDKIDAKKNVILDHHKSPHTHTREPLSLVPILTRRESMLRRERERREKCFR
jgi:hypothetical protein